MPASILGALVMGGVNNVTVLQVFLVILSIIGFGLIFHNYKVLWLMPALAAYSIGMYINLASPGNSKRMAWYEGMRLSISQAIIKSFQELGGHARNEDLYVNVPSNHIHYNQNLEKTQMFMS